MFITRDCPSFSYKFAIKLLLPILACLALSGCGGGASTPVQVEPPPDGPPIEPPSRPVEPVAVDPYKPLQPPDDPLQPPVDPPPVQPPHAGFANQWGLNTINADSAWAKLQLKHGENTAPGAGITLGVIDSGIDQHHPVFSGKTITERFLMGATDEDGTRNSHGTSVASVMAANPSQNFIDQTSGARGVAWGADITMFAIPLGSGGGPFVPISLSGLKNWDHPTKFPAIINEATRWSKSGRSLDFVNASLGFRSIVDMYSTSDLVSSLNNLVNAIKQSSSSSKTVFIWAAGNANGKNCNRGDFPARHRNFCVNGKINAVSPGVLAGLPARFPELRANHIAVVAVDDNGEIASFSNRCGIARDSCIAAPGKEVRVAFYGPYQGRDGLRGSYSASGTSFAAPMVTGGLAVMKHFFRNQLSNTALVSRLYATANKSGIYANRAIYGQGLMDLNAAVSPVGSTSLALGNRVNDGGVSVDSTSLNLGAAFGDGLTQSFANQEFVAFDQLGAPFWYSLDGLTGTRSGPSLQSRLTKFMSWTNKDREFGVLQPALGAFPTERSTLNSDRLSLGLMDTPDLVNDGGHLSLLGRAIALNRPVSERLGFSLFSSEGTSDQARVAGMEFVSRPSKKNIAFRSGVVAERQSLLRSSAAGAFGRMSGNSVFAGLEGNLRVSSWHLSAGAEVGTVIADIDESLLSVKSPLITSAFAFRARKRLNERDTLNFALSQPVRIESGHAGITIPVGRTVDGDVLKSSYSVDLEPSGRQIDLVMQWRRSLPHSNEDFRLATGLSLHPGHSGVAEPTISVLAGWRRGF